MSFRELKVLLDQVPDTRELVLRREASRGPAWNALYDAWSDAHDEAEGAWRTWRANGGHAAYAAYRAAAAREGPAEAGGARAGGLFAEPRGGRPPPAPSRAPEAAPQAS